MVSFTVTEDLDGVTGGNNNNSHNKTAMDTTNNDSSSSSSSSSSLGMISLGSQLTALCIPHATRCLLKK